MGKTAIHLFFLFVSMFLIQMLICNHIILFGVAVPLVFVYFIVRAPMNLNRNVLLTLSFLLGLSVDIVSDTPGVNALACTLLAMLKRPVFFAYVQREDRVLDIIPNIVTLGPALYCKYMFTLVGIFCLLVFSIEYFSFADVQIIVLMAASSSLLTFVLLLGVDSFVTYRKSKR